MPSLSAQKPKQSRKATANTGFGDDLTTEILLRLPAKSLLKLKTVSKQWLSIFSNRRFRQVHASQHPCRNLAATGLFLTKHENLRIYNSKSPPTYLRNTKYHPLEEEQAAAAASISALFDIDRSCCIVSSCNGLLLLTTYRYDDHNPLQAQWQAYYVCNPTTKEIKPLNIGFPHNLVRDVSECLVFDPSKSPHYKVVFLWVNDINSSDPALHIVIHSSGAGIHSRSLVIKNTSLTSDVLRNLIYAGRPVFCNGVIHWVTSWPDTFFYFDIDRELMKKGPRPPGLGCNRYFGESRGRLRLARVSDTHSPKATLDVYELEKDYSGWVLEYRIDLAASVGIRFPRIISKTGGYHWYTVVSILGDQKDELTMVLRVRDGFVLYHLGKETAKKLSDLPSASPTHDDDYNSIIYWWKSRLHQYTETLACLS